MNWFLKFLWRTLWHKRKIFAVAYLGFHKGGAKFSLATSAHTKGGPNYVFPIFFYGEKHNFLPRGGHGRFGQGVNTPLDICVISLQTARWCQPTGKNCDFLSVHHVRFSFIERSCCQNIGLTHTSSREFFIFQNSMFGEYFIFLILVLWEWLYIKEIRADFLGDNLVPCSQVPEMISQSFITFFW